MYKPVSRLCSFDTHVYFCAPFLTMLYRSCLFVFEIEIKKFVILKVGNSKVNTTPQVLKI